MSRRAASLDRYREEWETLPPGGDDDRWELVPTLAAASDLLRELETQLNQLEAGETVDFDAPYSGDFAVTIAGALRGHMHRWEQTDLPPGDQRTELIPALGGTAQLLVTLHDRVEKRLAEGDPTI